MFSYIKKNEVSYIILLLILSPFRVSSPSAPPFRSAFCPHSVPRFIPISFRFSVPRFISIPFRLSVPRFIPIPFRLSVPRFIPIPFRFSVPFRHSGCAFYPNPFLRIQFCLIPTNLIGKAVINLALFTVGMEAAACSFQFNIRK